MGKCRAAVFIGAGKPLEIQEFLVPEVEPGAVLLKMEMAAVCGSDVHNLHNPVTPHPVIWGHENIGIIAEMSKDISTDVIGHRLKEGDRVIFRAMPCGRCFGCNIGQNCQVVNFYGFRTFNKPPHIRGGFGQYIYLDPNPWLLRVPDQMPTERALISVVGNHTVMHGIERIGGIAPSDTVVVQGSGPIGMAALIQSKIAGAKKVLVIGGPAQRLKLAKEMGADEIVDVSEYKEPQQRVEKVSEFTGGKGADVIVECSGADTAVQEGLEMLRFGGKYSVVGQATDYGIKPLNPSLITRKSLLISGVWSAKPNHIIRSLEAMDAVVKYPVERLVTHLFPLDKINDAFKVAEKLEGMVVVILPNK